MTDHSDPKHNAVQDTFSVEKHFQAAPSRVFAAWADPARKARWSGWPPELQRGEYVLDFREGGREYAAGGAPGDPVYSFDARYHDIIPDERIVYTSEMHRDEARISVSVTTVEFLPKGSGTRLVLTEQDVFLDGFDDSVSREAGTIDLLAALGREVDAG